MLFHLYLIFLIVNLIQCRKSVFEEEANPNLCNFFDTINITDGDRNSDDSITFENVRYAKRYYGTFNYTYLVNHEKIPVPSHIRGCICKYKNCVRLCCPYGHSFTNVKIDKSDRHLCVPNNEIAEINLTDYSNMAFVSEMPFSTGYFLDPNEPLHQWRILPNGSLIISEDKKPSLADRNRYCLAQIYNNATADYVVRVMLYAIRKKHQTPQIVGLVIYPAVMLVSVFFYTITLFVYIWIDELRKTIHGKTLMCYLGTLIIGYTFLALTHFLNMHAYRDKIKCVIFAEIIHASFIGGFIWLAIIGYDIWRRVSRADNHEKHFLKYSLFAFGTTLLIVLLTNLLDHVNLLGEQFRPGLGMTVCWLQEESKYAYFLYLYLIIIIVITTNTVLFILTKIKIESIQKMTDCAITGDGSRKFPAEETDTDRFVLFLRLFLIMGLPWIIEIVSWLTGLSNIIIYVMDIITMLQGPFIFFLFIRKKRVKRLIEQKWWTFRTNLSNSD